jgi:hypothetical protein
MLDYVAKKCDIKTMEALQGEEVLPALRHGDTVEGRVMTFCRMEHWNLRQHQNLLGWGLRCPTALEFGLPVSTQGITLPPSAEVCYPEQTSGCWEPTHAGDSARKSRRARALSLGAFETTAPSRR